MSRPKMSGLSKPCPVEITYGSSPLMSRSGRCEAVQFNLGPYLVEVHDHPTPADPILAQPGLLFFRDRKLAFVIPIVNPVEF
jgi:hypothetical protein